MNKINKELKNIADKLNISKRIDPVNNSTAFISVKDHKPDFENRPKCRLINPCKSILMSLLFSFVLLPHQYTPYRTCGLWNIDHSNTTL